MDELPEDQVDTQDEATTTTTLSFEELFTVPRMRATWRDIRRELKSLIARDAVDWVDWAIRLEGSLHEIREEILSGDYVPSPLTRVEEGKSKGSLRVLTSLNIRDALIYRHICDYALDLALPSKVRGAYFSRRHTVTPVGRTFDPRLDPYDRFFAVWLHYNQYRTRTMLNEPYEVLVTTDISNYFDSIQHDLLFEYLAPLGLPRKAVGLLRRMIEVFRPDSGHSPSPRVGIPVDELDCSRELAHIFLFEHDRRVTDAFGENNYARWMDDQNIGARSLTEARRVINVMTKSLSQQRLTLNSGKTRFLGPEDVAVHFHLEANELLNGWWESLRDAGWNMTVDIRNRLLQIWQDISTGPAAGKGHWDKVVKRFYGYAARANLDFLEHRAMDDLISFPHYASRIFEYYSKRNEGHLLLAMFEDYCEAGENLYEAVETKFFEALLLLDPTDEIVDSIVNFSEAFAAGNHAHQTGRPLARSTATVSLYWFDGDPNTISTIHAQQDAPRLPKEVARSWLATIATLDPDRLQGVLMALFGHPSDDVRSLVMFLEGLTNGTVESLGNYKHRKPRWPLPGRFYDAQTWLQFELSSQGANAQLLNTARHHFPHFQAVTRTEPERRVLARCADRLELHMNDE